MFPLDMNGIMSRGISPSRHTPSRDMTFGCSKDNMVDISLVSRSKSPEDKRATYYRDIYMSLDITQSKHAHF